MNNVYDKLKKIEISLQLNDLEKAMKQVEKLKSEVFNTRLKNTRCPYCETGKVPYNEAGLLCDECREMFGHSTYSEL